MRRIYQVHGIALFLSVFFFIFVFFPPCIFADQPPRIALTSEETAFLKKHPRIVLGNVKDREPAVIVCKDGSIIGFDVDILDFVNQCTGANFVMQAVRRQDLIEKAINREIDGFSCAVPFEERKKYFNFSHSYIKVKRAVIVLQGNPLNIHNWNDLRQKRIVILSNNRPEEELVKILPDAIIVRVDTVREIADTIISGKADAAIGHFNYMYVASKFGISTLQFAFPIKEKSCDLVFAIRKDWPLAQSIMNKGLRAISRKKYELIRNKWLGSFPEERFGFSRFLKIIIPLALVIATLVACYLRKLNRQLLFVQAELKTDIARRKQAQKELDRELEINKALAELAHSFISAGRNINDIALKVLSSAKMLTQSKYGFVSEIDRTTGKNRIYGMPDKFSNFRQPVEPGQELFFPIGENGLYPKLWGHALNTGEPFFSNSFSNYPEATGIPKEHIPLERFLCMPVKYAGKVVGQIALANPPSDYVDCDMETVQRLADLYALAIQRDRDIEDGRRIEIQLRQAQKMEALGTLAGGIAHDFNNILTAILGYAELLHFRAGKGQANTESIEKIVKAGKRARDLVMQILTFSRKQEFNFKSIDLNQVTRQTVQMLARTFPKMVKIDHYLSDELWPIKADSGNMTQVVMNLCTNAKDAMPEGGRLVIETSNVSLNQESTNQHADAVPGRYIRLVVSDTGSGMDKKTMEQIFDPFFTNKEIGKGTGLGLSTVYGIVKSHGGYINCYSEPGQGTTFEIHIPALDARSVVEDVKENGAKELRGGGETILLVDDEKQIREMGKEMLTDWGYSVFCADSGEAALELFQEQGEKTDLVILDIGMPGMGGGKCLKALLGFNPELKIIVSSGYASCGQLETGSVTGAAAFLPKPFTLVEILTVVRDILDQ